MHCILFLSTFTVYIHYPEVVMKLMTAVSLFETLLLFSADKVTDAASCLYDIDVSTKLAAFPFLFDSATNQ